MRLAKNSSKTPRNSRRATAVLRRFGLLAGVMVALAVPPRAAFAQGALSNGEIHSASISSPGEIDTWTFTASQNDFISLSIGEVLPGGPDPGFVPWIRLQNPMGVQIGSNSGALVGQINVTAPLTGTYTVLVASNDSFNDATGSYRLTLAKAPGTFVVPAGDQGGAMTNGANHPGHIYVGDLDMWSFEASQNDHISLSIGELPFGEVDPGFNPWIRLIGPAGAIVGNNSGTLVGQISINAPISGTYTVLVTTNDSFNDAAGDYRLTLAKIPGMFTVPDGDEGGPLTNGGNHLGHIHVGDLDMWSFSANQNDSISLSIGEPPFGETDPGFNPWIRLISPAGVLVGSNSGTLVGQITVIAPLSGTYTVIVTTADSFNDAEGNYRLTLAKIPGTFLVNNEPEDPDEPEDNDGGPMTNGAIHTGNIRVGDLDQWSFQAAQNDFISVSIGEPPFGEVDPGFNPWIRLVGPTGVLIGSDSGILVGQINVTAPLSGTYTVLVATADSFNDATGNYRLTLAKTPGTFIVSAGDQGGPMTNLAVHPGGIYVGDLDQWTFNAVQNASVSVSITEPPPGEIDPGFNPWIRLLSPTGVLLASNSGTVSAQINVTAPLTGTYTLLVGTADSFNDAAGSYQLSVTGASSTAPTMALDKTSLRFGAVTNGAALLSQTSAQGVRLTQTGAGTVTWTATPSQPWLQVSPASGSGSANLSISVVSAGGLPPGGTVAGAITLSFVGASNSPGPINVSLTLFLNGTSANPFGFVDTPTDLRTGVTGAIPFTGWALDDIEVARVSVCRAAFGAEVAPVDPNCGGFAQIFVGFAVFIDGARPDVASAYSTYPVNTKGGWGFMVLTNMLPNQGNGTYVFQMWAQDREGHNVVLGTRTMTCANATATLPFGAIDTPEQGGVASGGAYVNFGWALTPLPKTIPTDGSTISVLVDGVAIGTASYSNLRPDIASLFPGLNNSNGAIGFRVLDTTTLTNGTHTISWVVSDNQGATEGIGSRFFTVSNGTGSLTTAVEAYADAGRTNRASRGIGSGSASGVSDPSLPLDSNVVLGRSGWHLNAPLRPFSRDASGRTIVRSEEVSRVELQLGAGPHVGYLRTSDGPSPLPVGSHLEPTTGVFTWAPGVGFVGSYDFVFLRLEGERPVARQDVRIVIAPKGSGSIGAQVVIDTPRSQQDVEQPFVLAGWSADLSATQGTGIATLHVWAYPLSGGPPVFLGTRRVTAPRGRTWPQCTESQFADSGFGLHVQGLPHGNFDLAVFAWSTVTGGFVPAKVVRATVR